MVVKRERKKSIGALFHLVGGSLERVRGKEGGGWGM